MVARVFGPGPPNDPPDAIETEIAHGDTLVLLSRASCGPGVPVAEVVRRAATAPSPEALAQQLAEASMAAGDTPYAAVAVVRLDALA
ncbi:MAG: hypothetical protein OHK0013_20440 [Sandaracinaceae bacterium]